VNRDKPLSFFKARTIFSPQNHLRVWIRSRLALTQVSSNLVECRPERHLRPRRRYRNGESSGDSPLGGRSITNRSRNKESQQAYRQKKYSPKMGKSPPESHRAGATNKTA